MFFRLTVENYVSSVKEKRLGMIACILVYLAGSKNLWHGAKWFLFPLRFGHFNDNFSPYRVAWSRAYEEIRVNKMKGVGQ